jgi:hypothetical protein
MPPKPGPMTPAEIARVKADLERARGFYWINSHMKMNLRFDWLEIDDAYEGFPFERYAYYTLEDRKKLDEIIAAHGRRTHGARGGIVVIYGARHWDTTEQAWVLSDGDGKTWGSPYDGSGICVFNAGGDTAWLFTHEYGLQLDIMANQFGHRYEPDRAHDGDSVSDNGTYWDGAASVARTFKPSSYLANFYGEVRLVRDDDNDGFPDDDPRCPFDEKRFGTSTRSIDSDRDGVDDLAEAMFSEWPPDVGLDFITFDARTARPYFRPQPYNDDTDGDTIRDARDAFPLDPVWPEVAKADVVIDGTAADGEWQKRSTRVIDDNEFTGTVRINWRDEGLCFLIEQQVTPEQADAYRKADAPMQVTVRLDGNGDGWTAGSDNSTVRLDAKPDGTASVHTDHWDNSRGDSIRTENTVIKPDEVKAAWTVSGDRFVFELMIPRNVEAGINCVPGEPLGFDLELKPAGAAHGLRLFEPQVLFDFTLR